MRRFATNLDTPDPSTNELQRADCAPFTTFGDGAITATDVIQVRRFAAGLDPFTPAGGPSSRPTGELLTTKGESQTVGRELRIGTALRNNGISVRVPVEMKAYGDEVAVGFTLTFEEGVFVNPRVTLGPTAPDGSTLSVNAEKDGRIAILLDSPGRMVASGVPTELVYVELDIVGGADRGSVPLAFTSDLAVRSVSDELGGSLPTLFTNGNIELGEYKERAAVDRTMDMWFLKYPMLPLIGTSLSLF